MHDSLEENDRIYLEKLRLAADTLLRLGEDPDVLPNALEADLFALRDRIERALLLAQANPPSRSSQPPTAS